jgi:hypothetical protein
MMPCWICLDTLLAKNVEGEANSYSNRPKLKIFARSGDEVAAVAGA